MKHLKLFEDFSDPGFGVKILNVSPEKMDSLTSDKILKKKNAGGVGIMANKVAKSLGKSKPLDAFKKIYISGDTIAFALK